MEQHPYIFQPIVDGDTHPDSCFDNYYQWGQYYEKQGENEKAVERYRLAHTQNNVNATYKLAEYNLARNRLKAGNLTKTIKYLETACEKGIVYATLNLAILFTNKQDLPQAENVIKRYSKHSLNGFLQNIDEKHHGIIHYFLGIHYEQYGLCGNIEGAIEHYIKSYNLGFEQGIQKLTNLPINGRELFDALTRKNIPILCAEKYHKYSQCQTCQTCEKYTLCKPFGYLRLCELCEKLASKTQSDLLYDCYKECCDKHGLNQFIGEYGGTVEKSFEQIIIVSKTRNYCNEIIYAGRRTNNALYAQITKTDCNTFTERVKSRAISQMSHYVARIEMDDKRYDKAIEIYKIISKTYVAFGKIANNIGYCYNEKEMFSTGLKYYLLAYETGEVTASHNCCITYHDLNDKTNALKYLGVVISSPCVF